MLLLLSAGLLAGSLAVLIVKKNRESFLLSGMCLALTLFLVGIMLVIAKRGGVSQEVEGFLYFSREIRLWIQYRFITLDQMGYLIAIGRHLFPLFLLEMAIHYSMSAWIRKFLHLRYWVALLPVATLILYWPKLYRTLIAALPWTKAALYYFSWLWVIGYVVLSLVLLGVEYFSITIPFCRRQFAQVAVCLLSLSALYLLYSGQDPGQVYSFYSYDYLWIRGVGYLQYSLTVPGYTLLVVVNVICGVLGLGSLLRYTQDVFSNDRADVSLERKFDVARSGASVFVHSIKNQLLANRVLYKRIRAELSREEPDLEKLRGYTDSLSDNNDLLISRSEELYRTVKAKSVRLVPVRLDRLVEIAQTRFYKKYPEGRLQIQVNGEIQVLADENYLGEALYNLLTNAHEATVEAGGTEPVELLSHQERLYTVLEVRDRGVGVAPDKIRSIFEPFYSGKNTNFNWGMGLYHTRAIVRSHLGSIRVENRAGGGASFLILLPRYSPR